jgi:hypothetical protein
MIYLKDTTDTQYIRVPANGPKMEGDILLEMENTINRGTPFVLTLTPAAFVPARFIVVSDEPFIDSEGRQFVVRAPSPDRSRYYYFCSVQLPADAQPGEYEYRVTIGGEVISCGLAIVGDPTAHVTTYDNNQRYEQYQSES